MAPRLGRNLMKKQIKILKQKWPGKFTFILKFKKLRHCEGTAVMKQSKNCPANSKNINF